MGSFGKKYAEASDASGSFYIQDGIEAVNTLDDLAKIQAITGPKSSTAFVMNSNDYEIHMEFKRNLSLGIRTRDLWEVYCTQRDEKATKEENPSPKQIMFMCYLKPSALSSIQKVKSLNDRTSISFDSTVVKESGKLNIKDFWTAFQIF